MNRFAFSVLILVFLSPALFGQELQTTTFYIVRHADRDGVNDALTEAGKKRAEELAALMKILRVNAIYSTDTQRTQSTAKPTADALGLSIDSYDELSSTWFDDLKSNHQGKVVLIVGHSNTSGMIANGLGGEGDFTLGEDEYDNLFIVNVSENGTHAMRIRYGCGHAKG